MAAFKENRGARSMRSVNGTDYRVFGYPVISCDIERFSMIGALMLISTSSVPPCLRVRQRFDSIVSAPPLCCEISIHSMDVRI